MNLYGLIPLTELFGEEDEYFGHFISELESVYVKGYYSSVGVISFYYDGGLPVADYYIESTSLNYFLDTSETCSEHESKFMLDCIYNILNKNRYFLKNFLEGE